jgi:hypothetical protein
MARCCNAECNLSRVSCMISVINEPCKLSVVMLNAIMPNVIALVSVTAVGLEPLTLG